MQAFSCTVCAYIYDDATADKSLEGTPISFPDLDEEWRCPNCGVRPNMFKQIDSDRPPQVPSE